MKTGMLRVSGRLQFSVLKPVVLKNKDTKAPNIILILADDIGESILQKKGPFMGNISGTGPSGKETGSWFGIK